MSVRFALLPFLVLLAACDSAAPVADDDARAASGEVLEGSISDAMLPLETLRSQPPVAAPLPGEEPAGEAGAAPEGEAAEPADDTDSAEEPASEPAEAE